MNSSHRASRGSSVALVLALLLGACGEGQGRSLTGRARTPIVVDQVVRDYLVRPPEWEIRRAHSKQAPSVDVITPAFRPVLDGADMLSLVMPPPAEVRFRIDEQDGAGILRLRAGVDVSVVKQLGARAHEGRFVFEVRVNDQAVHHSTVDLAVDGKHAGGIGTEWQDVGGSGGVAVKPGDVVSLITRAERTSGMPLDERSLVMSGFGGIRLERRRVVPRTRSAPENPNVVLVVMDTLRLDRLSTYGYGRETSPNLDRLAERGVVFEEAHAASSWTWPSTATILTGLLPEEHGVRDSSSCFLAWELETLAEVLQSAGFTTAAWSANPLVTASRNFDQGFEFFADGDGIRRASTYFHEVTGWLDSWAGTRFFLYLHLTEPHRPFEPDAPGNVHMAPSVPDTAFEDARRIANLLDGGRGFDEQGNSILDELVTPEERQTISDLYDAGVWSGDLWLGRLMAKLDALQLTDETLIVFTSDHGEELFEHSYLGHSKTLYRELVRAPLVLAGPGIPSGRRLPRPVSSIHLAPLIASLVGARLRTGVDPEAFLSGVWEADPVLYSTARGVWNGRREVKLRGMRWGDYSVQMLAEAPGDREGGFDGPPARVFDLRADPGELHNRFGEPSEWVDRAQRELVERFEALQASFDQHDFSIGEGTADMLERIGYAGH